MHKSIAIVGAVLIGVLSVSAQDADKAGVAVKSGQKIAFLGDSITAGGMSPAGYVMLTVAGLKANGIDASAIGAGISGHKSNDMLARLGRDVISRKPDWMTLSCGVNDVWHGANGVALEQYKSNITAIVDQTQAAGIKVMILTATVIKEDLNNSENQKLAAYNDFLRGLAKEKKCLLADLNANFQTAIKAKTKPENALTVDGVHMNLHGNQLMAKGILGAFGLDAAQMAKAEDGWLDIPGTFDASPMLQGTLKLSQRQQQHLETIASKYGLTVEQAARLLYAAPALGGVPGTTAADVEAFLSKNAKENPASVMQNSLTNAITVLLGK